jgi:hypothetical protein
MMRISVGGFAVMMATRDTKIDDLVKVGSGSIPIRF